MFKITKPNANRVDIEISGALDAETMRHALDMLIAQSEGVAAGRMLYRISDFALPTFGAIAVEIARLPSLFALLAKFHKCAVLCDTAWLRHAGEIEGALLPGIEIKSFAFGDVDAAEAWLAA